MKKEISKEERVKIFAQYLGCKTTHSALSITWLNFYYENDVGVKLILKPLSSISDEDAIEVAKILHPSAANISFEGRNSFSVFLYAVYRVNNNEVLRSILQIHKDGGFNPNENADADKILPAYQYLQSKSYALPYLNHSVEDLIDSGIYVIEK